ncbi:MAG: rubrerythrin family protein [Chthoniobacterales bacterium]|nr:rubrerythrin family protein [Chthoniobacterales bacterium]
MKTITIALAAALALLAPPAARTEVPAPTIKNLNAAFQGESNASNRYAIFAEKADAEGHPEVAKLFRAASTSEAIHRDNHRKAILGLGGKIEAFELETVAPGSTADNLEAAIKGETYEQETMYPEFLAVAEKDDARSAMRTFKFAMETEKEHAKLYRTALDSLGKQGPVEYYVCQVCGMTLTGVPGKKCPVCRKSRDEYKKIR